jgi:hypothetical protein
MRVSLKEADVLSACLDYLRLKGVLAWRSNNTGVFDPVLLAVECKGARGSVSADQEWFLEEVARRGGIALCVRSVRELDEQLSPLLSSQSSLPEMTAP